MQVSVKKIVCFLLGKGATFVAVIWFCALVIDVSRTQKILGCNSGHIRKTFLHQKVIFGCNTTNGSKSEWRIGDDERLFAGFFWINHERNINLSRANYSLSLMSPVLQDEGNYKCIWSNGDILSKYCLLLIAFDPCSVTAVASETNH